MSLSASPQVQTDTWCKAVWSTFADLIDAPSFEMGRSYFDNGYMRIEMSPLGAGHSRQNSVVSKVVSLFAMIHCLRTAEFVNGSFHQAGERGCQPDLAFYIGADFELPPQNNAPVDVNRYGPPTLVVEVASSTFKDDLGAKRLLYERLGVTEYWVVNVADRTVIAFAMANRRSGEIVTSAVLPGLEMSLIEAALTRSQTEDDSALMRWLMDIWQSSDR
ncbi:Uma2 family endonuclease [Halomicronema sp. CCY15110]|uniref:Uma2 family endonuclease n=1 Tax=Halomicronema sp. CCY15110 TaxID=2767773 RepID=UPI0019512B9C|nr:Uma2 family endonuclease [Halomicronema sp. CCY15110]